MLGLAPLKQWLEQRILEDAAVEGVFKATERILASCEFVEGGHPPIVWATMHASNNGPPELRTVPPAAADWDGSARLPREHLGQETQTSDCAAGSTE